MSWSASLRLAIRALNKNRIGALLTILGVLMGVGSVIAMLGIGTGSKQKIQMALEKIGANTVVVNAGSATRSGVRTWAGTATRLKVADTAAIAELDNVVAVSSIAEKLTQVRYRGTNWATKVQGVDPQFMSIRRWELLQGEFFTDQQTERTAHVCVLGHTVAFELFGFKNPVGETIIIQNIVYRVLGVLSAKGASGGGNDQDDLILMPVTTVQRKVSIKDYITQILVEAPDKSAALTLKSDIQVLMRERHRIKEGQADDFNVNTSADLAEASEESARVFIWLLGSIGSVSLLVGGIGIMNIMLVSVRERTKEIGIRMSLGARYRDILTQFLLEALVLSGVGGIIGVILGIGIAQVVGHFSNLPVLITGWSILLAFFFSTFIGIVFGLYPAKKAARMQPSVALRYE